MTDEPPSSSSSGLYRTGRQTDPNSIDGIINALYGALSFESGGRPDFAKLQTLFSSGARLMKVSGEQAEIMELTAFVRRVQSAMAGGRLESFREKELARRTDVFGPIAQVFGTFERTTTSAETSSRGINAIQLRNDGARWWIESLMWSDETEGLPLPAAYLPRETRGDEVKKRRRGRTLRTQPYGASSSG